MQTQTFLQEQQRRSRHAPDSPTLPQLGATCRSVCTDTRSRPRERVHLSVPSLSSGQDHIITYHRNSDEHNSRCYIHSLLRSPLPSSLLSSSPSCPSSCTRWSSTSPTTPCSHNTSSLSPTYSPRLMRSAYPSKHSLILKKRAIYEILTRRYCPEACLVCMHAWMWVCTCAHLYIDSSFFLCTYAGACIEPSSLDFDEVFS